MGTGVGFSADEKLNGIKVQYVGQMRDDVLTESDWLHCWH